MSKPKIDWSKSPHAGLDNDATWLKCENSTLRAKIKELEAEVDRLKKANNDSLWCGQRYESRIAELEAENNNLIVKVQFAESVIRDEKQIERTATKAALRWAYLHPVDSANNDCDTFVRMGTTALLGEK